MATVAAPCASPALTGSLVNLGTRAPKSKAKVVYVRGMNGYAGLKAYNAVSTLGKPISSDLAFVKVACSLYKGSRGVGGGGALSATCNKIAEIFQIAAIMNGITLVGVAVGFVLLRIEASFEESE